MAESYIDFGPMGMLVPIFLLGVLYGLQYRYVITRTRHLMFAFGALPVVLKTASEYGLTVVKVLGSSITTFGVFLVAFFLIAPYLYRIIQNPLSIKRDESQRSVESIIAAAEVRLKLLKASRKLEG